MKKFIVLSLFFVFIACQHSALHPKLMEADSLFHREEPDSAVQMLNGIVPSSLDKANLMYYILLKTIGQYKQYVPIESDTVLDGCIEYYRDTKDYNHLAMAYVYKSSILSENNKQKEAVLCLKEAESLLHDIDDVDIKIRILSNLAFENEFSGNYQKAFSYIKRALIKAKQVNNRRWIAFCYELLSVIYSDINQLDSCDYYQKLAIPYISFMPRREQSLAYSNLSSYYYRKGDYLNTEELLKKSISIYPTVDAYGRLAEFYSFQGNHAKADSCWEIVLKTNDLEHRSLLYFTYADWLAKQGKKEKGWIFLKKIPALKDSLAYQRQAEAIKEVQDGYDREMAKLMFEKNLQLAIAGIVFLVLILWLVWMSYRLKSQKAKMKLAENQVLIAKYTTQIKQLVKEGKDSSKEVRELQRKIDAIRDSHIEMLYKGKDKYDEIIQGGNTLTWHKSDFNDVIEYYRSVDLPFVLHLEQEYRSLSASDKFFLLLKEIGMQEEEIQQIMGLTDGALRTKRSRIKEKEIQIGE